MKTKLILWAACLSCLSTPAYSTGLLEAKLAAVGGVVKGAGLLGAGVLAAKGAVLKGAGSLLAAKGAAIKKLALAGAAKPIKVPVPGIILEPPTIITKEPILVPVPAVPVEVPVVPSLTSLLLDKLNGPVNTAEKTFDNKITVRVNSVKSPIVYEVVRTPRIYPVPAVPC